MAVAFARLFFPAEARVAMENAEADSTSLYANSSALKGSSGILKEVDLNETPSVRTKKLQLRMHALLKTGMSKKMFQMNSLYWCIIREKRYDLFLGCNPITYQNCENFGIR